MYVRKKHITIKSLIVYSALLVCLVMLCIGKTQAAMLYGVTGDGGTPSETLFELSQSDASSTFVLTLGNGDDGEAIGFNPDDGLLYHASGHFDDFDGVDGVVFEQINSTFTGTTDIDIMGSDLTDEEAQALTWDASRGEFLWKQDHDTGPLFSVTTTGVETLIGDMDHQAKGLAFIGSTLYSVSSNGDDLLRVINTLDASTISSIAITLAGETVRHATGLATHPDTDVLWALLDITGDSPGLRQLVTIEPITGVATSIGPTDVEGMAGLAFDAASVPEPATMTLLGIGLVGLVGASVRRRFKKVKQE